jgi:hypothetical protein
LSRPRIDPRIAGAHIADAAAECRRRIEAALAGCFDHVADRFRGRFAGGPQIADGLIGLRTAPGLQQLATLSLSSCQTMVAISPPQNPSAWRTFRPRLSPA